MCGPFVRRFAAATVLLAVCGPFFAEAHDDATTLDIWLGARGSAQLNFVLDEAPANPVDFEQALADVIGASETYVDTEVYEALPDGTYVVSDAQTQWEVSAYAGYDRPLNWVYDVILDFRPLVDALDGAGLEQIHVHIYGPRLPLNEFPEAMSLEYEYQGGFARFVDLSVGDSVAPLRFHYGYPRAWFVRRAVFFASLLLLPTTMALWLRRTAGAAPPGEAGYACFTAARWNGRALAIFWTGWIGALVATRPREIVEFYWTGALYAYPWLPTCAFYLVALIATLPAQPLLFPVFERFPGATWRRRDFFYQGLYLNLMIVVLLVFATAFASALFRERLPQALAWAVGGLVALVILYRLYLTSLGFRPQTVEEGELRERVDQIARRAGIPRIQILSVVYFTKAPLPNAFAANGVRLMLTEYLLKLLTKREVDAIVAHEVGHLKARHPQKLLLATAAVSATAFIAVFIAGLASYNMFYDLGSFPKVAFAATLVALVTGALFRYPLARRFEREADAAAVEISEDPEACISALTKITRLNFMPLKLRRSDAALSTHPSTRDRVETIARQNGIPEDRLQALVDDGDPGTEHYEIPLSANPERVLSSGHKSTVSMVLSLSTLAIAAFVPCLAGWFALTLPGLDGPGSSVNSAQILATIVGGAGATAAALVLFHNFGALAGFWGLKRKLSNRFSIPDGSDWSFVAFTPCDGLYLFELFTNWDIGFFRLQNGSLLYRGDAAAFDLPAARIESVSIQRRRDLGWLKITRLHIQWRMSEGDDTRNYFFEAADARSLSGANRMTAKLYREVTDWWKTQRDATSEVTELIPPALDVHGQPARELLSPARFFASVLMAGLLGYFTSQGLPLSTTLTGNPWELSVGFAAALGFAIAALPQLSLAGDNTPGPPPLPSDDPFDSSKE